MVAVTSAMNHLVRNPEKTRYPHVKARRVDEFKGKIEYLEAHHTFITVDEFVNATRDSQAANDLPRNPVILTFDDAYSDHYETVFPILHEKK